MRKQPPDGPRFSNCPIWAIYRYAKRGGYLHIRQSKNVRWLPHFMWSRKMDSPWWGYVPNKPRRGLVATIHSLGFCGKIKQEKKRVRGFDMNTTGNAGSKESGVTTIEYALLASLIAVAVYLIVQLATA